MTRNRKNSESNDTFPAIYVVRRVAFDWVRGKTTVMPVEQVCLDPLRSMFRMREIPPVRGKGLAGLCPTYHINMALLLLFSPAVSPIGSLLAQHTSRFQFCPLKPYRYAVPTPQSHSRGRH